MSMRKHRSAVQGFCEALGVCDVPRELALTTMMMMMMTMVQHNLRKYNTQDASFTFVFSNDLSSACRKLPEISLNLYSDSFGTLCRSENSRIQCRVSFYRRQYSEDYATISGIVTKCDWSILKENIDYLTIYVFCAYM